MPAVIDLRWRSLYEPLGLAREDFLEECEAVDAEPETIHVAAYDDKLLIATARIERNDTYDFYLGLMATAPMYRNKGVGSLVLQHAEDLAHQRGAEVLGLHAHPAAVAFYEKNGFTRLGKTAVGLIQHTLILAPAMEKTVRGVTRAQWLKNE